MSTNLPIPPKTTSIPARNATNDNLFAAVDIGTNSFKLLIVRADPSTGRFLAVDRFKERVLLGLDTTTTTTTSATISTASLLRATTALRNFQKLLQSRRVPSSHSRFVATSAVREASNQSQFLQSIDETLGLKVDVLSGLEEARLIYQGILQFHPVHDRTVLTIDIGGGSTEFVIGKEGNILFSISLALGHVTLAQKFPQVTEMREHIKFIIRASGLKEKVKLYDIDNVIGSSGTILGILRRRFSMAMQVHVECIFEENKRDWSFTADELKGLVEMLSKEERSGGKVRKQSFFKKSLKFVVAGAVLLEEIFEELKLEEMEVSGYALGEGVIAEKLGEAFDNYDPRANARWRSIVRLGTRFNNKQRMKSAALCFSVAKEMFDGLKNRHELGNGSDGFVVSVEDKDLEFLEAACLLQKIGLCVGKKGYHKQSYHIIMNGDHLHGYNDTEVKLIALLVRHHRKKLPEYDDVVPDELTEEMRGKFRILCAILRVSAAVEKLQLANIDNVEFSHTCEGYKLVLEAGNLPFPGNELPSVEDFEAELGAELEHFRMVFLERLSIAVTSSTSA
ncbi:putative exopolyphosphatase [Capsicum annuum]|uniref:Ppx-GppA phosphatase protein (Exopolyphosphatase) n=1 Tax=Capsicum annuum TaxID=4072 RepID=B1GUU8_CAPAN|nr:putative exopolyphosphatase [Capsicum annuum]CAP08387.1 Ppx-GppA phosphatase protein (exopolyphosphatase) [Capsicum annuum]